jgi:AraC-like DNA-binding protein
LVRCHEQCREAVATSEERSTLQLSSARLQQDLCLLEAFEYDRTVDGVFRIDLAIGYLQNHLNERPSIKRLCDYLQVTEATLKRLFRDHTGKSPREFVHEWRMRWAKEHLLRAEGSVKSVAYALGYRHPADFSRAYKSYFGSSASDLLRTPPGANDAISA